MFAPCHLYSLLELRLPQLLIQYCQKKKLFLKNQFWWGVWGRACLPTIFFVKDLKILILSIIKIMSKKKFFLKDLFFLQIFRKFSSSIFFRCTTFFYFFEKQKRYILRDQAQKYFFGSRQFAPTPQNRCFFIV